MKTQVSITISPKDEKNDSLIRKLILREAVKQFPKKDAGQIRKGNFGADGNASLNRLFEANHKIDFVQTKKSIDARHGGLKIHLRYDVFIDEEISESDFEKLPEWKKADGKKSVIIVGSGPAGLFGALKLLEHGIKPIIIERGNKTDERKKAIAQISTKQTVDENSNYCFGEGGAGTFSDGKLYTRSNKRGDTGRILRIFVEFGADKKILTDAHPHIGTDRLPKIINNMREKILECGGEFYFNTKVVGIERGENTVDVRMRSTQRHTDNSATVASVRSTRSRIPLTSRPLSCDVECESILTGDAILLATGHSATDIYKMIADISPESLEAKTFAVGVRVEHPRKLIDDIQYHKKSITQQRQSGADSNTSHIATSLGAAEYRLTTQVDGRGVYSFCMCPGGFVVPSQTGPDEIVVNGMSNCKRNSAWSNAAIVVETRPEDIPEIFITQAKNDGCPALAGLYYRTHLEKLAKENGSEQKAPAQKLVDFLAHRESHFETSSANPNGQSVGDTVSSNPNEQSVGDRITSYTPGIVSSRLDKWLPPEISNRLSEGFKNFDRNMHGFISDKALMIAIETRTSTPVRILRDSETFECAGLKGVYPAGEGSGYSGGIVSSAMDGENVCEKIFLALSTSKRCCQNQI